MTDSARRGEEGAAIDVHCHYVSRDLLDVDRRFTARRDEREGEALYYDERRLGPLPPKLTDLALTIEDMARARLSHRLTCTASWLTCYWADPALGKEISRATNEAIARGVAGYPDRLMGLASLPMQNVDLAIEELHHAVDRLGMVGVAIGTNVNGVYLDHPRFAPLLAEVEASGVPMFLHPDHVGGVERLGGYGLTLALGNPHEAATALCHVILGGVLERYPNLKLCFPMGGGSIVPLLGRITHGWSVRPEAGALAPQPPVEYLRRCFFDTVVHSSESFEFLLNTVPTSQLLLGSDWPWDMGLTQPRSVIEDSSLDGELRDAVLVGNVSRLLTRAPIESERLAKEEA